MQNLGEKYKKLWGYNVLLVDGNGYKVFECRAKPLTYCSLHLHEHRRNYFHVVEGDLCITIVGEDGENEWIWLKKGADYCVEKGVLHRFETYGGCLFYETYTGQRCELDDIVRVEPGGKLEIPEGDIVIVEPGDKEAQDQPRHANYSMPCEIGTAVLDASRVILKGDCSMDAKIQRGED